MIGKIAFSCCTGLKQLIIPAWITVGEHAFEGCTDLSQLSISTGVSVGKGAFWRCSGLTQVTIYEDINFDESVFMGCKNLKEIFVYSNNMAEIERIKNSLPQHMQAICVAHPLYEQIEGIRENALTKIRCEHIEPIAHHNKMTLFASLPETADSKFNVCYQEAQNKILRAQGFIIEEKNADEDKSQVCTIS